MWISRGDCDWGIWEVTGGSCMLIGNSMSMATCRDRSMGPVSMEPPWDGNGYLHLVGRCHGDLVWVYLFKGSALVNKTGRHDT